MFLTISLVRSLGFCQQKSVVCWPSQADKVLDIQFLKNEAATMSDWRSFVAGAAAYGGEAHGTPDSVLAKVLTTIKATLGMRASGASATLDLLAGMDGGLPNRGV